ncbi:MAG: hypothetical protein J6T60_08115 [Bacteroidales bacterium]|nr:hypothetical protein [Bacteroidales bacterium]
MEKVINPIVGVKEHNNELVLKCDAATSMSFVEENGHCITDEQPYSGTSSEFDSEKHKLTITVKAGRKASKSVATWFDQQVDNKDSCMIATQDHGDTPDDLNFAVSGTLTFTADDETYSVSLVIAQGCTKIHNNWWLASNQMIVLKPDPNLVDERGFLVCDLSLRGICTLVVREDEANSFTLTYLSTK